MVAKVLVQISSKSVDKTFDYLVPKVLEQEVAVGKRVVVSFGTQELEGFVLGLSQTRDREDLKEIKSVVDQEVILNEELLQLGKYMQEKTLSSLISCYQVMLPKALKARYGNSVGKKKKIFYELTGVVDASSYPTKQQEIIKLLLTTPLVEKTKLEAISPSSLHTLEKKNIIRRVEKEIYRYQRELTKKEVYPLTKEQQAIVDRVLAHFHEAKPFLLHGVTGSGKTEVYMELIVHALKEGKNAIVLVPEISLTPQIINRFQNRFGDAIAVMHSGLSDGERYDEWRKIARKEVRIVIGARSAIFAPLDNLGLIVIDEVHSDTYKQENNPKYQAIDVALFRSKTHGCPVVMGSATPSLELYARAQKGVFELLELPHRVNQKAMPQVHLVDMFKEMQRGNHHFSTMLVEEMKKRLERKEQVILLLNRRGYASFISCQECGYTEKCPNCDITLTYHKTSHMLRCHYCGYATKKNDVCPECKKASLKDLGTGTEKIEEELHTLLPEARILRMDVDTTSRRGSHEKMIMAFQNHEYDILLGTQIVAKGLDFEDVTLVGVINADTSLNIPDFRSSEATFQLLDQVSGRSGRKEKEGIVIIQTYNIDHYAIVAAKNHDYLGFYQQEMNIRRTLKYPPYYYLAYVRVMSKDYSLAGKTANQVAEFLKRNLPNTILLGPSTCSVFRVNGIYRFGIILKYKSEDALYPTLKRLDEHYRTISQVTVDFDFEPNHL